MKHNQAVVLVAARILRSMGRHACCKIYVLLDYAEKMMLKNSVKMKEEDVTLPIPQN
jgi:hypothetical protein